MNKDEYFKKFKDPRWQKKRLEILNRDKFTCQSCSDKESTLHVHHRYYELGKDPWDYTNEALVTLCEDCHEGEKEYRKFHEKSIISDLKKMVLAEDVFSLSVGIHCINTTHDYGTVIRFISYILQRKNIIDPLIDQYLLRHKKGNKVGNK